MTDLKKETFICLDCEATGLDTNRDEIIELAVVKFNFSENLSTFEAMIDPKMKIPEDAIAVHHITDDMVIGKALVGDVLPQAFDLIGDHTVVGHNIGYDIEMIIQAAKRNKLPCPVNHENSIDTLRLARLYAQSPTNSLEELRKHFNIQEEGAHRALNDVIVNIKVYKYLVESFASKKAIMKRLEEPILMKKFPLGKHRGLPFREVPIDYLNWASSQDFDEDLLYSINQERRRRKSKKSFSYNPFSDL